MEVNTYGRRRVRIVVRSVGELFQGLYSTEWTLLMAASIMMLAPMMLVFILGQRYFIEGIRLGGVKG